MHKPAWYAIVGAADRRLGLCRCGGSPFALQKWMVDFYLHREHKFIVPAAAELLNDEEAMRMPTLASKAAVFLAHALRALPAESVGSVVSTMPFVLQEQRLLLAILRLAGLPQTRELFERLSISIRKASDRVSHSCPAAD